MSMLTAEELARLKPAATASYRSPIPTQVVSSDEFFPIPQTERLRRLEIPEDLQKKFGFAPLGPAEGPVKTAIFGTTSAKMYKYDIKKAGLERDRLTKLKADYVRDGGAPSHRRYGYVVAG